MKKLTYAGLTCRGLKRLQNEDNVIYHDQYLDVNHEDFCFSDEIEESGIYAVFDGLGGETNGEVASYLAAKTFTESMKSCNNVDFPAIIDTVHEANRAVCNYAQNHHIKHMGSTVACLCISESDQYIFNVGDSRVYTYNKGTLKQLSHDHCIKRNNRRYLTQCLGIPESEFLLSPHIVLLEEEMELILICSDGLTDMLTEEEITEIFSNKENKTLSELCTQLKNEVYDKGAQDNLSIILVAEIKDPIKEEKDIN